MINNKEASQISRKRDYLKGQIKIKRGIDRNAPT
jgi:hypothetical protein